MLRRLQLWTGNKRTRHCRRTPVAAGGPVFKASQTKDGEARWGVSGLQSCGSGTACPVCARTICAQRAQEIMDVLTAVGERGGSVALITLTMRHHKGQSLKYLWDQLSGAWNAVNHGRGMGVERELFGILGRIRVVEVMHSPENGWHVHAHVLVCFDTPVSPELARDLGERWFMRWERYLTRKGMSPPIMDKGGLDVRPVDIGSETAVRSIGEYLAKITHEMVGGQVKEGRKSGSRSPFAILRDCLETGLADDCELWLEWEQASFRRRMITWHDGIREWAGLREEATDQQIVDEDRGGREVLAIDAADTRRVVANLPTILDMGEIYGVAAVRSWLSARGVRSITPRAAPKRRRRRRG
jgi:hypothetical protein